MSSLAPRNEARDVTIYREIEEGGGEEKESVHAEREGERGGEWGGKKGGRDGGRERGKEGWRGKETDQNIWIV